MVYLMWALFPDEHRHWTLLHFNHRLRGSESDMDAGFVETLGNMLNIPVRSGEWSTAIPQASEADCRCARHAFFATVTRELNLEGILLAHHMEDVAETLLLRIARGGGVEGLSGPRPIQVFNSGWIALRPLLCFRKEEMRQILTEQGLFWREDQSNQTEHYTRNRLRHRVIPELETAIPQGFIEGAARIRNSAEELLQLLDRLLFDVHPAELSNPISVAFLCGKPRALCRHFLSLWLDQFVPVAVSGEHREKVLNAIQTPGTFRLSFEAGEIVLSKDFLEWKTPSTECGVAACAWKSDWQSQLGLQLTLYLPTGAQLHIEEIAVDDALRERILSGDVDPQSEAFITSESLDCVSAMITIRTRNSGDRYQPLGSLGVTKLQDAFINRKIPRTERNHLPVVCFEDSIAWVPGLLPADAFKLTPSTKRTHKLTYISH
jgi:tRNA(Ile)-lysidine synthase